MTNDRSEAYMEYRRRMRQCALGLPPKPTLTDLVSNAAEKRTASRLSWAAASHARKISNLALDAANYAEHIASQMEDEMSAAEDRLEDFRRDNPPEESTSTKYDDMTDADLARAWNAESSWPVAEEMARRMLPPERNT